MPCRLYREDGLSLRLKRPRRNVSADNRERQPAALAANKMWSMDFVSDALFDGRRLRAPTVVESFNGRLRDEWLNTRWFLCWRTPEPRSRPGAGTITRGGLTRRLAG